MYLSKLELHGFKSFADRTVVHFAPGVTVVVGPNGCGKSNIVDAVRWVIGEQRARILRSEKMDNVIFNGAGHRKALGVAEVMLTIENNRGILPIEYSEVTIGRRLYRSGDSEYLLNGTQCRLKDITDLFMDTGMGAGAYSVIELKMIEELLSENEQDRRKLFEEAAGITKYKIRRSQTLRKLDGTQVDLTRVRDLADELDRRVRSLERQAKKASRYKKHRSRLETLELSLAQSEFDRLTDERQSLAAGRPHWATNWRRMERNWPVVRQSTRPFARSTSSASRFWWPSRPASARISRNSTRRSRTNGWCLSAWPSHRGTSNIFPASRKRRRPARRCSPNRWSPSRRPP
jgi:chromosome segregation protein